MFFFQYFKNVVAVMFKINIVVVYWKYEYKLSMFDQSIEFFCNLGEPGTTKLLKSLINIFGNSYENTSLMLYILRS